MSHEFWLIITALLVAIVCTFNGNFMVLRKQAMFGDAISHSVLLGLILAYLLIDDRSLIWLFVGALASGLAAAAITQLLQNVFKLKQQDSIGIVFTSFFAVAVILITYYAGHVDLDQSCVLFGEIAFTPIDVIQINGQNTGPRVVWMLTIVLIITLGLFISAWYRLKSICFDPIHSTANGINVGLWQWLLTALVAICAVSAFDAVGAIMVVAMLTIIPNTAKRLAKSLLGMFMIGLGLSAVSAIGGYYVSSFIDGSIAATMAVFAGLLFAISLLYQKPLQSRLILPRLFRKF